MDWHNMFCCIWRKGERAHASYCFGAAASGGDDAYNLEPARQARERETGFYLVRVNCWCCFVLSTPVDKLVFSSLNLALPGQQRSCRSHLLCYPDTRL